MTGKQRRFWLAVFGACAAAVLAANLIVGLATRDLPNYTQIEDGLYLGGYVSEPPPGTQAVLNLDETVDPFRAEVHRWQPIRDEMFVRLLVLERKDIEARVAQLASQEQVYREYLAQLMAERKLHDSGGKYGDRLLRSLATDAAIFHAQAHLRWLAHARKLLRRHAGSDAARPRRSTDVDVEVPDLIGRVAAEAHSA
jgi:hypothetical protein